MIPAANHMMGSEDGGSPQSPATSEMAAILNALSGEKPSPLTYCCDGDKHASLSYAASLHQQLGELVRNEKVRRVGLFFRNDHGGDCPGSNPIFDIRRFSKALAPLKKVSEHFIGRPVFFSAGSSLHDVEYYICAMSAALVLEPNNPSALNENSWQLSSRSPMQPHGPRPSILPTLIDNPTEEEMRTLVSRFLNAHTEVRKASAAQAKVHKLHPFKKNRGKRQLTLQQMEALLPINKAYHGVGVGDTILRVAMTVPLSQARAAKKREDSISREALVDLMWAHALQTGGIRPPFVKL